MKLISIIIPFVMGLLILRLAVRRIRFIEYLGFSFPIGVGMITMLMFLMDVLSIQISKSTILYTSIGTILVLLAPMIVKVKSFFEDAKSTNYCDFFTVGRFNLIWLIFIVGVSGLLFFITKKNLYVPTFSTDAISSFDLYAKAIAREGTLLNSLIYDRGVGYGAAYPPLTALSLSYAYIFGYESSKIIPALFFISFIVAFYALGLKSGSSLAAIIAASFIVTSPELLAQSALNTTSVPQAMYASLGMASLMVWHVLKEKRYLILSIVMLALNGWIRSEGIVYIGAAFLFCLYVDLVINKKLKNSILILLSFAPFILWQIYMKLNMEVMDPFVQVKMHLTPNLDMDYFGSILRGASKNFFQSHYYGITSYAFLILCVINLYLVIRKKQSFLFLSLVVVPLIVYLVLLNQLELRADTIDAIMKASAKRFFFGVVGIVWFYFLNVDTVKQFFIRLETFVSLPQKQQK